MGTTGEQPIQGELATIDELQQMEQWASSILLRQPAVYLRRYYYSLEDGELEAHVGTASNYYDVSLPSAVRFGVKRGGRSIFSADYPSDNSDVRVNETTETDTLDIEVALQNFLDSGTLYEKDEWIVNFFQTAVPFLDSKELTATLLHRPIYLEEDIATHIADVMRSQVAAIRPAPIVARELLIPIDDQGSNVFLVARKDTGQEIKNGAVKPVLYVEYKDAETGQVYYYQRSNKGHIILATAPLTAASNVVGGRYGITFNTDEPKTRPRKHEVALLAEALSSAAIASLSLN